MRYIFTAATCTLLFIAALLALPPIGESDTGLIAQTAGDRLAVVTNSLEPSAIDRAPGTTTPNFGREAVSPSSTAVEVEVLNQVGKSLRKLHH